MTLSTRIDFFYGFYICSQWAFIHALLSRVPFALAGLSCLTCSHGLKSGQCHGKSALDLLVANFEMTTCTVMSELEAIFNVMHYINLRFRQLKLNYLSKTYVAKAATTCAIKLQLNEKNRLRLINLKLKTLF